ncbi:MAG: ABC transporter permease [Palaeococcus sp.]|uniref:ABC transporter permease n=1 Tax=Palaeococcus sp. (in: euryarchaeotes) TaxID=2820298 RepID=UPI0025CF1952|nr:ABC transporter permease [Palaeococcus sp. (in: euryarchaeotes)]MCD6558840.1 ABC transporter permease [Palaeococcus sp. (in: euryarchaeotes)]
MRWSDFKDSVSNFWFDFKKQKTGLLAIVLLIFWIGIALAAPLITSPDIPSTWQNYWIDYPKNVPPKWVNAFSSQTLAVHEIFTSDQLKQYMVKTDEGFKIEIPYKNIYDVPPQDIVIKNITGTSPNPRRTPKMDVIIVRPDGEQITILSGYKIKGATTLQLGRSEAVRRATINWVKEKTGVQLTPQKEFEYLATLDSMKVLFAKISPDMLDRPKSLKGDYKVIINVRIPEGINVSVDNTEVIFNGRSYGWLGTDYKGRDLLAGLIWGSRVSLTIGISISVLSVLIGIFYGVTSAYLGGWTDEFMQRINEFVASIPSLPILILLGSYFGGHIELWQIVFLLVLFGWVGIAKVARSMALQIKEQVYVEAARALGAGTGRVIFRHMVPQLLPYAFAQMALSVPSAVLSEASLSFLGLGDPTKVTWGQILHDAQVAGAAVNGYWWWVIPPGLAIALVGLTFVLLGTALDRVLNPRLRRL